MSASEWRERTTDVDVELLRRRFVRTFSGVRTVELTFMNDEPEQEIAQTLHKIGWVLGANGPADADEITQLVEQLHDDDEHDS